MNISFKEFNKIIGQIDSTYHEAALKLNLTDSEFDILYVLCAHEPGCCQSVLYKETWMTKSTANSAINKMKKADILYLKPGSGRNTLVYLTDKGKQLAHETVYKIIQMENEIYESWSRDEQELFITLNKDYADKLSAMVDNLTV